MAEEIILTARILIQGPQAPHPGLLFALPVYRYEVARRVGDFEPGAQLDVAHQTADSDDTGFSVGASRCLWLERELPPSSSLWFAEDFKPLGPVWFCSRSDAVDSAQTELPR